MSSQHNAAKYCAAMRVAELIGKGYKIHKPAIEYLKSLDVLDASFYKGDDPQNEMLGVDEVLCAVRDAGFPNVGDASSIRAEIQSRIDDVSLIVELREEKEWSNAKANLTSGLRKAEEAMMELIDRTEDSTDAGCSVEHEPLQSLPFGSEEGEPSD